MAGATGATGAQVSAFYLLCKSSWVTSSEHDSSVVSCSSFRVEAPNSDHAGASVCLNVPLIHAVFFFRLKDPYL